ncbi:MAG TPA: hypothetical protein VNX61_05615 [Rhizomicrobium sp.]|nr:hypothetical protein [Rhizomicrobium sp.]
MDNRAACVFEAVADQQLAFSGHEFQSLGIDIGDAAIIQGLDIGGAARGDAGGAFASIQNSVMAIMVIRRGVWLIKDADPDLDEMAAWQRREIDRGEFLHRAADGAVGAGHHLAVRVIGIVQHLGRGGVEPGAVKFLAVQRQAKNLAGLVETGAAIEATRAIDGRQACGDHAVGDVTMGRCCQQVGHRC